MKATAAQRAAAQRRTLSSRRWRGGGLDAVFNDSLPLAGRWLTPAASARAETLLRVWWANQHEMP